MSYTVVLLDDNQNTVRSLEVGIDWAAHGLTLVGTAYDGTRGGLLIQQLHPDIVISDICMPGLDGLSLIEQEKENLAHSRVILITGYDKFQYAAQAIRLSVFDYILKPIVDEELLASLERACADLNREYNDSAHQEELALVRRRACMLSQLSVPDLSRAVPDFINSTPAQYCFFVASVPVIVSQPILQRLSAFLRTLPIDALSAVQNDFLIIYCGFPQPTDNIKQTMVRIQRMLVSELPEICCAVSWPRTDLSAFPLAWQEAYQAVVSCKADSADGMLIFCVNPQESTELPHISDLQAACQTALDTATTEQEVWETLINATHRQLPQLRILLMMYSTQLLQKHIAYSAAANPPDVAIYDIPYLTSIETAHQWMSRFYAKISTASSEKNNISPLIRSVLAYIMAYATDGLSLENVSEHFHVSPHYLSGLVHKETGETFRQHVIHAKIEVSKKMLDDTRMRIEDIAYAVGYENYISYYNIFKRMEGETPTEYRSRSRTEH